MQSGFAPDEFVRVINGSRTSERTSADPADMNEGMEGLCKPRKIEDSPFGSVDCCDISPTNCPFDLSDLIAIKS